MNTKDLAQRLKSLTGHCRETDALIAIAVGFEPDGLYPHTIQDVMRHYSHDELVEDMDSEHSILKNIPRYTSSIDSAITLIPDAPWQWNLTIATAYNAASLIPHHDNSYGILDPHTQNAYGDNSAIAICIASLKAMESSNDE